MNSKNWSRACLVFLALFLLTSCGDDQASTATAPTTSDDPCDGPLTDVAKEPNYSADYPLIRWKTSDGCSLRLDVAMTRQDACFDEVDEIVLGWPPPSVAEGGDASIFVRDPKNQFRDREIAAAYDPDTRLPEEARDSGVRQDEMELWLDGEDDKFIYLVTSNKTERWPQDFTPPGCR